MIKISYFNHTATLNIKVKLNEAGWGESLLSLPKKWLSTQMSGAEDDEFQYVTVAKLPVPDLQATIDTYLDFTSVILNPQQQENTRDLAKKFIEDVGPKLQSILLQRQKEKVNWANGEVSLPNS
ncbi:unnamed protein product [Leptosia nina]|uniref:Choline/carnitine acyltransferase domain-containing protein n=1 Tax=Leptosia nina TaxID=320188 RepID=A0AAV1J6B4_9NEOP